MSQQTPTVLEIDRKLRDDFRRRIKDFGIVADTTDPLLAVLFRTFAQQIEQVYSDTGRIRQSLLNELMAGIQMQQHLARPAQTAVRFLSSSPHAKVLRADTELNAKASTGERLVFGLDATLDVSAARISFALAYQAQTLQWLTGVEMSDALQAYRPSLEPVRINLGAQPSVFVAVENLPPTSLSRHGIFFELGPGTYRIQDALRREPWWIFGADGDLSSEGLMRPRRVNSGVYQLDWQVRENAGTTADDGNLPAIPDGFYSGRQFVFPRMDAGPELMCHCPVLLEAALARLCGREVSGLLATPRVWIKIPMPPEVVALHHSINNILLHTMTASNVFCRNQTVRFERDGASIPVSRDTGAPEYLVAPLAVTGVANEPYEQGMRPRQNAATGWYELHNNRLTLHPGLNADDTPHEAANVRLWLTNGELANRVGPGDITGFANSATFDRMEVAHLSAAAGGTNGEDYGSEQRRFAEALLTRGRIVTRADLQAAALAYDRRILRAEVQSRIERRVEGLRRVENLTLTLESESFAKPELELAALQLELEASLRARLVQGLELAVRFEWS